MQLIEECTFGHSAIVLDQNAPKARKTLQKLNKVIRLIRNFKNIVRSCYHLKNVSSFGASLYIDLYHYTAEYSVAEYVKGYWF